MAPQLYAYHYLKYHLLLTGNIKMWSWGSKCYTQLLRCVLVCLYFSSPTQIPSCRIWLGWVTLPGQRRLPQPALPNVFPNQVFCPREGGWQVIKKKKKKVFTVSVFPLLTSHKLPLSFASSLLSKQDKSTQYRLFCIWIYRVIDWDERMCIFPVWAALLFGHPQIQDVTSQGDSLPKIR